METDVAGLGPPLYQSTTLEEAEVTQGQRVVMEAGQPPLNTQVPLCLSVSLSVCMSVCLSVSFSLSICMSIRMSVYLNVHIFAMKFIVK